ncbi:cysteine desulfurase [bacterium]|nr:cysteine desulfurase [bacterium]
MSNAILEDILVEEPAQREGHSFDVYKIRQDFPILQKTVHGYPLVYLDNAASAQRPKQVIDVVNYYYSNQHANIHRGVHHLSETATKEYEVARRAVQRFINAKASHEIIFVRGTTEAVNLVAFSYGRDRISEGDEIIISTMEHHSNIVPWQILCEMTGAKLRIAPINDQGEIVLEDYRKLFSSRTKIVSMVHVSNSLGTINPVEEIIEIAHSHDVPMLLDGAQAVPHQPVDVQSLNCDFYAFSGHKVFGPTGIGVLFGKEALLESMSPYQGGGYMIESVSFDKTTYNRLPHKFEAGTPNIAGAIGLGVALDYLRGLGFDNIHAHEADLLEYATDSLSSLAGLRFIGTSARKASVISFVLDGVHPHDVGTILDRYGIAVRTGHHCTQPVMARFNIPATSRASFAFYNTREEVDALVEGLQKVIEMFN